MSPFWQSLIIALNRSLPFVEVASAVNNVFLTHTVSVYDKVNLADNPHIKGKLIYTVIIAFSDYDCFDFGIAWNTIWQRKNTILVRFTDIPAIIESVIPFQELCDDVV